MKLKILYISCHEVLEHDEIKLLTELGHEVFSLNGAYMDPSGHITLLRPGIGGMQLNEELVREAATFPRTEIPASFLNKFDLTIVMHIPEIIVRNWKSFKGRNVVWRTIGQSVSSTESILANARKEGLKIIRYSPAESRIPGFIGEDAIIRFYKDPDEFGNWTGHDKKAVNFTQSLLGRRAFCGYDSIVAMGHGVPLKVYGPGNEDLGEWNGGKLSYDLMKGQLRDARVYLYGGTWPASYTLSFMEALMTGIPIVSVGKELWKHRDNQNLDLFEVPEILENGVNGFVSDDIPTLRSYVKILMENDTLANVVSKAGRETALKLFSRDIIKKQWKEYLDAIN